MSENYFRFVFTDHMKWPVILWKQWRHSTSSWRSAGRSTRPCSLRRSLVSISDIIQGVFWLEFLVSDDQLLTKKCTERWKMMNERQKRWFIFLEIEGRKSRSKAPADLNLKPSGTRNKTSTPIRKSVKPGGGINIKKRFTSGGSRKLWVCIYTEDGVTGTKR